jgi:hypothetical protein
METLLPQNLRTSQTRKEEQNSKPSRKQEQRKLHILWKHSPKKKLTKKMMKLWTHNWKE